MTDLGMYDGRPIVMTSIVMRIAGGGLRDALALDPVLLHTGDEGYIAFKFCAEDIKHQMIKAKDGTDTGTYNRVVKLVALRGMLIDAATVEAGFQALQKRVEEAEGVSQLPLDDGNEGD